MISRATCISKLAAWPQAKRRWDLSQSEAQSMKSDARKLEDTAAEHKASSEAARQKALEVWPYYYKLVIPSFDRIFFLTAVASI